MPTDSAGPMRREPRTLWAGVALAVLVAAGGAFYLRVHSASSSSDATARLNGGADTPAVVASGAVSPVQTTILGSYVSGVIQDVRCDDNTPVTKGQVCATIDPRPFQTAVDQAQAALGAARAQLVRDQTALAYQELSAARYARLLAEDSVARNAAESAIAARNAQLAQVEYDKASIAQYEAALRAAEANLGYTQIVSPVDGVVVSRNVTQGQMIATNVQSPTLFVIAQDLSRMQVDADLREDEIGGDGRGVRVGDPATFTVAAYPKRTFQGRVDQIRQAPQTVRNVVTYDVVITADNSDLRLRPGMTAQVRIMPGGRGGGN